MAKAKPGQGQVLNRQYQSREYSPLLFRRHRTQPLELNSIDAEDVSRGRELMGRFSSQPAESNRERNSQFSIPANLHHHVRPMPFIFRCHDPQTRHGCRRLHPLSQLAKHLVGQRRLTFAFLVDSYQSDA
jgi:hypothetical protein